MSSKQLNIILGVIITILIVGLAYLYVVSGNKYSKSDLVSPEQLATSVDQVQWITYSNDKFGFTIQYPNDIKLERELDDEVGNRVVYFSRKGQPAMYVQLEEDNDKDLGVKYGLLGSVVTANEIKVGGMQGYKAVSYYGYGDAGQQGLPFVDYGVRYRGNVYHIVFNGDDNMSEQELKSLATFKLIK